MQGGRNEDEPSSLFLFSLKSSLGDGTVESLYFCVSFIEWGCRNAWEILIEMDLYGSKLFAGHDNHLFSFIDLRLLSSFLQILLPPLLGLGSFCHFIALYLGANNS